MTPRGNRYILTVVDYFTKWAEAFPLPTKEASGVVTVLFEVVTVHETCSIIIITIIIDILSIWFPKNHNL